MSEPPNQYTGCSTVCCLRDQSKWTEDGPKAWTVCLGSFLATFAVLGLVHSFGIFVVPISEEFGVNRAEISLVPTICMACIGFSGIFAGPLSDQYGNKPVMFVGWVLWIVGAISSSFCTEFSVLYFTQGVLVGVGAGTLSLPAWSVVPQWFNRFRGTAVSFTALGSAVGNIIYALAGQAILEELGWRDSLRAMTGFGAAVSLAGILLMDRRFPAKRSTGGLFEVAKRLIRVSGYQWFLGAIFCFQFGFYVPYVHLVAYISDVGLSPQVQSLALAMIGIGSAIGRVITGPVSDLVGRLAIFRACMFATAITFALWNVCTTAEGFYAFAFFYGAFAGGFLALLTVVTADLWGVANLGGSFSLLNVAQIPGSLAAGPIAGLIYTETGSYEAAIWMGAAMILASAFMLLRVSKEPVAAEKEEESSNEQQANKMDEENPNSTPSSIDNDNDDGTTKIVDRVLVKQLQTV